jgi:hypothetical protein
VAAAAAMAMAGAGCGGAAGAQGDGWPSMCTRCEIKRLLSMRNQALAQHLGDERRGPDIPY